MKKKIAPFRSWMSRVIDFLADVYPGVALSGFVVEKLIPHFEQVWRRGGSPEEAVTQTVQCGNEILVPNFRGFLAGTSAFHRWLQKNRNNKNNK